MNRDVHKAKTGISGLDDVLEGGFARSHLYLVEGEPGTGKTTLGLQFLLAGAEAGERCLHITLSETERELRDGAVSHGWSLRDEIKVCELLPPETLLAGEQQQSLLYASDLELGETTNQIFEAVKREEPSRIVLDSLSEIRLLAQSSLRYRRQVLALKHYFGRLGTTVLLLDDMTSDATDKTVHSIAHGVIRLEENAPSYGAERRRMRVVKYRGQKYRGGYHDLTITTGGIKVFPRLIAAEHRKRLARVRLSTGIGPFDRLLGGGVESGSSTVILGPAGTGKSLMAITFALAAIARGERAALFAFDEELGLLFDRMKGLNIDLEACRSSGHLVIEQIDAAELSPGEFAHRVRDTVDRHDVKTVVIDSLNGYQAAMAEENSLILHIHELLQYLNRQGAMTVMTVAQHGLVGEMHAPVDITYLADTVILLRYFEAHGSVRRAISVIKKRTGNHESTIPRVSHRFRRTHPGRAVGGLPRRAARCAELFRRQNAFAAREGLVNRPASPSLRALILAPNGRDAPLTVLLLKEAGFAAHVCGNLTHLGDELRQGAGLAIIADEAVQTADLRPLARFLEAQPAWSDLPIILLTHRGGGPERNPAALRLGQVLGNVSFLERPFHATTLTSMVRAAVRGRRRQYEAQVRLEEISEREEQLQTALTAGRLGSWTLDVERRMFHISETSRNHFGSISACEFSYEKLLQSVHPEDRNRLLEVMQHTLRTGADYVIEYRNIRADRSVHWVDVRARALKDKQGKVNCLVGVSSDITERKNSELERERLLGELASERTALSNLTRTLEQRVAERTGELLTEVAAREKAQEQLLQSQKMESVGQLTGGIAHDFNNLLMAVLGNLEILRKRLPNDPGTRRLIDGATQGARRGASLTQRMLAFARQQDLKTTSADIGALVGGMQELLKRSLGPDNELRLHIEPNLPPAEVDAHQVELAILNLAINARDAMPEGGVIDIHVDQARAGPGERLRPGVYLRIQITDSGCGMDAATLARAVEPFFSTKPLGKGTGLGLSMVHGLAVQLGGWLELASKVGEGTVATLWLPMATMPAAAQEAAAAHSLANRSATILVVDDDPLVAMSTVDMLEDLGHTAIEANSGERALEIIEAGQAIDLMVTDQAMPGMTGIRLAEIVRSKRPHLPVLLATGYTDLPASKLANLPRLSKPYHQEQLQAEIEKLLDTS